MFLKKLTIENNNLLIRSISFHKGINLIIDETRTDDRKESGNNVGKTTVLRLIDFCLGSDGKNIYQDTEFRKQGNTKVERFLKDNNIVITLILKEDLEDPKSSEIELRRNFMARTEKVREINGEKFSEKKYLSKLKELLFNSKQSKPTIRQIISKNIRDEKNRLVNTLKVLHPITTNVEYEALYLFWLGINLDNADKKQKLLAQRKLEKKLQSRLRKESNISQISQALLVIKRHIEQFEAQKDSFKLNNNYKEDIAILNNVKFKINKLSTQFSRLELRKELIIDSKNSLAEDLASINTIQVKKLYEEARSLIPNVQKTFEETLTFHNQMIKEKTRYITQELPDLEFELLSVKRKISKLLSQEKRLTEELVKLGAVEGLQKIISELNSAYERKGRLEEQKELWESSINSVDYIDKQLDEINKGIVSKDTLIQKRITEFNKYFSEISYRLYGEQFLLSSDKNEKGYELNISNLMGNLGTGKKKGQIAAFDLAYIRFADALGIECLHFVLQDQIENVHDNQISSLFTEIVSEVNCQYVLPVLRDKLPPDIDIEQYEILSLSQDKKLFLLE